ncbi:signal peptide peptidase-like 2A [Dermacentor silvarum]|uniref:signal peptide peptidase-like 2A n=1 Tax=Dermacentor silvarum TaxID=543639 RepID=UPI002100BF96|nr:signal peptide peptidase-like 2A [Dermacentor silvarum]
MKPGSFIAATIQIFLAGMAVHPVGASNRLDNAVILLKAENSSPVFFCAVFVPAIKDLPKKEEDAEYQPFLNTLNDTDCDYERRGFEGKVVLLERCDNTSNDELIQQAKSAKAKGVLVSVNASRAAEESKTVIKKLDIMVGFVANDTAHKIARYDDHNNQSLVVKLFWMPTSFDWSFIVIWMIAMGTVVGGAFWSGMVQLSQYQPKVTKPKKKSRRAVKSHHQASEANANIASNGSLVHIPADQDFSDSMGEMEEDFAVPLSPKLVIMFVIHMSVMLLVLYYFYRYLVHLIVIMFALASAAALLACLEPLVNRINIGTSKVPKQLAFCCQAPMEIREVVLMVVSFGVALAWLLLRHNDAVGWVLQDMLGIAFCINMLKSIHLPNLKMLALLLSLLLVYDVFFVFITPLLRANRESVMVEVAKGGNLQEALPMVVRFPRLVKGKYHACFPRKYSMLGLGDILAPGLLLSYCHAFDLLSLGKRFYFYISCAAYGVGMVATFLALHLMHMAQPALLYLVPCTIVPTVVTAWYKGHLFAIWNGLRLPSAPPLLATGAPENSRPPPTNERDRTPNHSETEELIPDEPTDQTGTGGRHKKSRRRKRSRRTSESATKSPAGGSAKEVVAAEGDETTHDAELLVAVERLIMPSPSALPTSPPNGVEDVAGVRKRSSAATLHWEEPFFCAQGGKLVPVADLPPKATASPFPPA